MDEILFLAITSFIPNLMVPFYIAGHLSVLSSTYGGCMHKPGMPTEVTTYHQNFIDTLDSQKTKHIIC